MDTEDINYLEEYFYKTNLRFYKEIMSKIKKDFSNINVGDLTDYFDITQELNGYFGDVVPPVSGMLCHSKQM